VHTGDGGADAGADAIADGRAIAVADDCTLARAHAAPVH
jgi:hypothetical protein